MSYWENVQSNLDKNLTDENEVLETKKKVIESFTEENNEEPNFEFNNSGRQRKLESLLGYTKKIPRREWTEKEQVYGDVPLGEMELWEKKRQDLQEYSERDRKVAYKRDELAEVDDEGYRYQPESPAFRDGYNNTLRIKPPSNPDLHNGKEVNIQGKALETYFNKQDVKSKPSEKSLQSLQIQKDNTRVNHDLQLKLQDPNVKTLRKNKHDLKIKQLFKPQGNVEIFTPNKKGVRKTLLKRDFHEKTLASFVLKALFTENNFGLDLTHEDKQRLKSVFKNGEVELEDLGKAFVELGFVLTPELREESKRNEFDSKAFKLGEKIMSSLDVNSSDRPVIQESLKEDMALAIGRTMNNLKSIVFETKGKLNTFEHEKTKKNNEVVLKSSSLTFQLINQLTMKQKGSTSYFRTEKNIEKEQQNKTLIALQGVTKNPNKSVWDALEKNLPNKTTRDILPARPDYL